LESVNEICFANFSVVRACPLRFGIRAAGSSISNYRLQHGEARVTSDATLNRIAHEQAAAMASKNLMDHDVPGPFSSRVAPSKARRNGENIAYGYDSFSKTLDQWINSSGHRQKERDDRANLLGDGDCRRL
jgi:uncharacterized protein YkwD